MNEDQSCSKPAAPFSGSGFSMASPAFPALRHELWYTEVASNLSTRKADRHGKGSVLFYELLVLFLLLDSIF